MTSRRKADTWGVIRILAGVIVLLVAGYFAWTAKGVEKNTDAMHAHEKLGGHTGMVEKVNGVQSDVSELKGDVREIKKDVKELLKR